MINYLWRLLQNLGLFQSVHKYLQTYVRPWYEWPEPLGLAALAIHRDILEQNNLLEAPGIDPPALSAFVLNTDTDLPEPTYRPDDGYGTDIRHPLAGALGAPFGRNCPAIPVANRLSDPGDPPVQMVAQKLLARRTEDEFYPAGMQLNVLAAVWIQAMVHDWVGHYDDFSKDGGVELKEGATYGCPLHSFQFHKTLERPHDDAYDSFRTHWWDGSWLYGQSEDAVEHVRSFKLGRVKLNEVGNTKLGMRNETTGTYYNTTGDNKDSWLGISLLQELFLKEHNAVAEAIVQNHPELDDDDEKIFGMARLVVSAELAKIHTVDWTVELLKTRTLKVGMWTNWYGFPNSIEGVPDFMKRHLPQIMKKTGNETEADDKGVPFSLTEEFVAVYRLHPLLPDHLIVHINDATTIKVPMSELVGEKGERALRADPSRPLQYWDSILRYPCGNLQLHNFPHFLRQLHPTDELGRQIPHPIDLAAVDLYRDRERGILRFNDFRRALHLKPYDNFLDLTGGDETLSSELAAVYGEDGIERCDMLVCRFAEQKIPGFALSETSFIVFLLMATRRLEADPFLHQYYTEKNYSPTGLHWVENTNSLRDVLQRHYPELLNDIPKGQSVFTPRTPWPGQVV